MAPQSNEDAEISPLNSSERAAGARFSSAEAPAFSSSSSVKGDDDSSLDSRKHAVVDGNLRSKQSEPTSPVGLNSPSDPIQRSNAVKLEKTGQAGRYLLTADESELHEILKLGIEREESRGIRKRRSKPKDLVFTRQFTAFDRQNPASSSSQFHGFFNLFWLGVGLMLFKVAANNWRIYGSIWGRNEILRLMFHKDVLVHAVTDGVLCGSTIFCLFLQRAIKAGYLRWNNSGWIIQNVWQTFYLGATIWWTYHRDWPWTHTVFIVLHCLTMLMKQHSYAFYNGHLSEVYRRRQVLEQKLAQLDDLDGSHFSPSASHFAVSYFDARDLNNLHRRRQSVPGTDSHKLIDISKEISIVSEAMESGKALNIEQTRSFTRLIRWEIDSLTEELAGECLVTTNHYPNNLTVADFYGFIPLPTLIYELEYPRQETINWMYALRRQLPRSV
ncbi:hypothetical protein VTN77DRAFT_2445 [Rasamsonia byssochlamydoides]|uniref:uncharacterized protein n=1 Tax=Rasamsonia byssochlamydoides TaxID=89139 RepID=UPI003743CE25